MDYKLHRLLIVDYFSGGPASHTDLLEKLAANVKRQQRAIKLLSKEAALLEIENFKAKTPTPEYLILKRLADECDAGEFQTTLARELKAVAPDLKILIVFIEDKPTCQLLAISPNEEFLKRIASDLCVVLEIKVGAGGLVCKNGRFQAKFANAKNIRKCDEIVKNALMQ